MGSLKECSEREGNTDKNNSALQTDRTIKPLSYSFISRTFRAFPWILTKKKYTASLTVEAAVVLPVFIITLMTFMGVMDLYMVHAKVRTSIHESAVTLASYAYKTNVESGGKELLENGMCLLYGNSRLPRLPENIKVSLIGSECREGEIYMKAEIRYKLPVNIFPMPAIKTISSCRVKCWTGWNGENKEIVSGPWEEMVYVAENESVYHSTPECTHIDISIHSTDKKNIESMRNEYGERYHMCQNCGKKSGGSDVYYTTKGNKYHTDPDCSGLKRTSWLVKKSKVQNLGKCERCMEHS